MNELDFQKHLVDAAVDYGGHAFKCNNRFLVGVADLSIKLQKRPHVYLECKKHNTLKGAQNTGLTPHQLKFLRDYRKAGGISAWATFAPIKGKRDAYRVFTCTTLEARIDFDAGHHVAWVMDRMRGEPWPIERMIDLIVATHGPHKSYTQS